MGPNDPPPFGADRLKWAWGVMYTQIDVSDGGPLTWIRVREDVVVLKGYGKWKDKTDPGMEGPWRNAGRTQDFVGNGQVMHDSPLDVAATTFRRFLLNPQSKGTGLELHQLWRYYDWSLPGGEPELSQAPLIRESGFLLGRFIPGDTFPNGLAKLVIEREPLAKRGVEKGLMVEGVGGKKEVAV